MDRSRDAANSVTCSAFVAPIVLVLESFFPTTEEAGSFLEHDHDHDHEHERGDTGKA